MNSRGEGVLAFGEEKVAHALWHTEPDGILAAESADLRLIVQASRDAGNSVRFLVLRRTKDGKHPYAVAYAIIGSGTAKDVRSAMEAAERMARQIQGLKLSRTKKSADRNATSAMGKDRAPPTDSILPEPTQ